MTLLKRMLKQLGQAWMPDPASSGPINGTATTLAPCNIELSRPAVSPTGQAHDSPLQYPNTKPLKGSASTTCYAHPLPIAGRAVL